MTDHKITGMCSICDHACFVGPGIATEDSVLITFLLYDGTKTDLTFCGACAEDSMQLVFGELWKKNLRSWLRELGEERPKWFVHQLENGILCELGRTKWKELQTDGQHT